MNDQQIADRFAAVLASIPQRRTAAAQLFEASPLLGRAVYGAALAEVTRRLDELEAFCTQAIAELQEGAPCPAFAM